MAVAASTVPLGSLFSAIKTHTSLMLLSDYDGTLAPYVVDRKLARPYPEIPAALANVAAHGIPVVIVSGRPAAEVQDLLGIGSIEIWGSHGAERLLSTGKYVLAHTPQPLHLEVLMEALEAEGLGELLEVKPVGVAVHWRGLPPDQISEVMFAATRAFHRNFVPGMKAFEFDGGIEFRPGTISKADAVRRLKDEHPSSPMLYMGDDLTDEDAFSALGETDLSVLVRNEYRDTAAKLWLKPPDELLSMLQFLATVAGGKR